MKAEIQHYNLLLTSNEKEVCNMLAQLINENIGEAESKVWHAHPVWFLDGNPIVGYAKRKNNVCLLFWSGQSFDEENLKASGKFKAAEIVYTNSEQIITTDIKRWLEKAKTIQWDYKNIVKRKGVLEPLF